MIQSETIVRAMQIADLPVVLAIERAAQAHPWTEGNFRDALASGNTTGLLMNPNGEALGYYVTMQTLDEAELLNLVVDPAWQGRGYGRLLLEHGLHLARSKAAAKLFLELRSGNHRALQLYRSVGLRQIGSRRGYYESENGIREDAIVMGLSL